MTFVIRKRTEMSLDEIFDQHQLEDISAAAQERSVDVVQLIKDAVLTDLVR